MVAFILVVGSLLCLNGYALVSASRTGKSRKTIDSKGDVTR